MTKNPTFFKELAKQNRLAVADIVEEMNKSIDNIKKTQKRLIKLYK